MLFRIENQELTMDWVDTFVSYQHLLDSFPNHNITVSNLCVHMRVCVRACIYVCLCVCVCFCVCMAINFFVYLITLVCSG